MIKLFLSIILATSVILFIYNYLVYPILIGFISKKNRDSHEENILPADELVEFPKVSFIVAAFNEEKVITDKMENTLKIDYPKSKLEFIIVSDGSTDSTPRLIEEFGNGVISLFDIKRGGKSSALNRAVEIATGEILVFSDANNDFSQDSVKQLVRHFVDDEVGAVTGAKHIYESNDRESSAGDSLYWKYESGIKKSESTLGSITAAEGEILAVRSSLYQPIDAYKVNDDAAITFDIVKGGYRVLYEENAKSTEQASIDMLDDINVKIRMTFGGFQTMSIEKKFLFPPKTWFAFTFFSHKVLRWFTPHLMILIFVCSLMLWENYFVGGMLVVQICFYALAYMGWRNRKKNELSNFLYIPMYFTAMNIALFIGFLRYQKNKKSINWEKAER